MKSVPAILALIVILGGMSSPGYCRDGKLEESSVNFDENTVYDIYFNSADNKGSIIRRVEILGFVTIADKIFLAVLPKGFNSKDYKGYILFDSISAIVPDKNFNIQ